MHAASDRRRVTASRWLFSRETELAPHALHLLCTHAPIYLPRPRWHRRYAEVQATHILCICPRCLACPCEECTTLLPSFLLSFYLFIFLSLKLPGSYVCRGQTIACHVQGTAEQAIKLEFGGRCKNEKSPLPRTQAPESGDDTLHEVFFNLRFCPAPSNGAPSCRRLRSSALPAVIDLQMAAHRKRCARAHCVGVSLSLIASLFSFTSTALSTSLSSCRGSHVLPLFRCRVLDGSVYFVLFLAPADCPRLFSRGVRARDERDPFCRPGAI